MNFFEKKNSERERGRKSIKVKESKISEKIREKGQDNYMTFLFPIKTWLQLISEERQLANLRLISKSADFLSANFRRL